MTLSLTALQAMFAQQTDEVFLTCLTIEHPDLQAPQRLVDDTVALTRAAGTFQPFPFRLSLPPQSGDEQGTVQVVIDSADRQVVELVRSITSPATVTIEVVLHSSPDVVEAGPYRMVLRGAAYDASALVLTLGYEVDLLSLPANRWRVTPQDCPGAF